MAYCPNCQQTFAEGGFCPYDGTSLQPDGPAAKVTQQGTTAGLVTKPFEQPRGRAANNPVGGSAPNAQSEKVAATEPGFSGPHKLQALSASSDRGQVAALAKLRSHDPKAEYKRLIGTTLDNRYLIEKKLGEGGMGVVFLAKHTIIEKLVAIKVLKREVARDHSVVKRFVQEAKAASRIGHPNIVDVTDFGTTPDGMTYSVMEYVEGETLSQIIKDSSPLDLARALPVVAQLAKALGAAHQKGIVHRDLKPENVFLIDRDGRPDFVKIVDFGIAKIMPLEGNAEGPRLTRAGTVFGTPEYMAPEQAAGRSDTDRRVDIYALGTILYEMIVGRVPHKGQTMVRTLAMQMLDPIPPPREARPGLDISAEFEHVLMKALAKKREQRYPDMETFLAELESVSAVPLSVPLSPSLGAAPPTAPKVARAAAGDRTMLEGEAVAKNRPETLPRLPPGADPAKIAEAEGQSTRRRRPASNTDPAFLNGRPAFDHVFDDPQLRRAAPARWPFTLVAIVLLAGGAYGAYWLSQKGGGEPQQNPVVTPANDKVDASTTLTRTAAAGTSDDAATVIVRTKTDAGTKTTHVWPHRGVDAAVHIGRREDVMVRINTRPEGARVFIDGIYRGTSQDGGVAISAPFGSRLIATCKLPGYKPGVVTITFTKKRFSFDCIMTRVKKCVPGLKNPFDNCPK